MNPVNPPAHDAITDTVVGAISHSVDARRRSIALPECPFPGLRPFGKKDSIVFFGRETQVEQLQERLDRHRFLAITGVSGTGKSSLVGAGLIPALRVSSHHEWRVIVMRPGQPFQNLQSALQEELGPQIQVIDVLRRSSLGLVEIAAMLKPEENLLIVVDQFEELFRVADEAEGQEAKARAEAEAAQFVRLLLEGARYPGVPVYIVVTMRSDYFGDCARFRDLSEVLNESNYLVPRMTSTQRQAAIEKPIKLFGADITQNLVDRLLNDFGDEPDQLPVLQHALMRTWNAWCSGGKVGKLDLCHYDNKQVGGSNAINTHAEQIYERLESPDAKNVAEIVFKRLTLLDTRSRRVRKITKLADLEALVMLEQRGLVRTVINCFGRETLISVPLQDLKPDSLVDISHEKVIEIWQRLRDWVSKEAQLANWYQEVTARAKSYPNRSLLRGKDLYFALEARKEWTPAWSRRYNEDFEAVEKFLAISEAEAARAEKEAQSEKRLRIGAVTGLIAAIVLFAVWFAYSGYRNNQDLRNRSTASSGLQNALDLRSRNGPFRLEKSAVAAIDAYQAFLKLSPSDRRVFPDFRNVGVWESFAMFGQQKILPIQSMGPACGVSFQDDGSLVSVHLKGIQVFRPSSQSTLIAVSGGCSEAVFSPGAKFVAITSGSGIQLVDIASQSRSEIAKFAATRGGPIENRRVELAFSPDSRYVAWAKPDGTAWIAGTANPNPTMVLDDYSDVRCLAFAPTGMLAFGGGPYRGDSKQANLFLLAPPSEKKANPKPLKLGSGSVTTIAFSPNGGKIAIGYDSGLVRLENVVAEARTPSKPIADHNHSPVTRLAFDSSGRFLASGSEGGVVEVSDTRPDPNSPGPNYISQFYLQSSLGALAFSADMTYFGLGGGDGLARVIETATGKEVLRVSHGDRVGSVAFSKDNRFASSGGWATVSQLPRHVLTRLLDCSGGNPSQGIVFGPSGQSIAVACGGEVRYLELKNGSVPQPLISLPNGNVQALTLSGDGNRLVIAASDKGTPILVKQLGDKKEPLKIPHQGPILSLAVSQQGDWIAYTIRDDRSVRQSGKAPSEDGVMVTSVSPDAASQTLPAHRTTGLPVELPALAFDPSDRASSGRPRLAAGGTDGCVTVFDSNGAVRTGNLGSAVLAVQFGYNGRLAATTAESELHLLDVKDLGAGNQCSELGEHFIAILPGRAQQIAFGPSDRYVAVSLQVDISQGYEEVVRVFDVQSNREFARISESHTPMALVFPQGDTVTLTTATRVYKDLVKIATRTARPMNLLPEICEAGKGWGSIPTLGEGPSNAIKSDDIKRMSSNCDAIQKEADKDKSAETAK